MTRQATETREWTSRHAPKWEPEETLALFRVRGALAFKRRGVAFRSALVRWLARPRPLRQIAGA